jgi:hypothetical protein
MSGKKQKTEIGEPLRIFVKLVFAAVALLLGGYNVFGLSLAGAFPGEISYPTIEKVWFWVFTFVPLGIAAYFLLKKDLRLSIALLILVALILIYFSGLYYIMKSFS